MSAVDVRHVLDDKLLFMDMPTDPPGDTRNPYADPYDSKGKNYVADLRAFDRLPRQVTLAEMRANTALKKMKLLKNVRLLISPITDVEYQEILRMAGIVATPGIPLP